MIPGELGRELLSLGRELLSLGVWKGPLAETLFCSKITVGAQGGMEGRVGRRNPQLGKATVKVLLLENFPKFALLMEKLEIPEDSSKTGIPELGSSKSKP